VDLEQVRWLRSSADRVDGVGGHIYLRRRVRRLRDKKQDLAGRVAEAWRDHSGICGIVPAAAGEQERSKDEKDIAAGCQRVRDPCAFRHCCGAERGRANASITH